MSGEKRSLWFVTEIGTVEAGDGGEGGRGGEDVGGGFGARLAGQLRGGLVRRVEIGAEDLKREIGNLIAVVGDVFNQARSEAGLSLEEVELSIEISSEGQVSILGSGGKIGGSGGIKLSFKRQRPAGAA
jgi:hypothetical protein